jgi:hypothetical protein
MKVIVMFSCQIAVVLFALFEGTWAFAPSFGTSRPSATKLFADATTTDTTGVSVDPKEAVKLFGRLAEKYIMLDASAGLCCYSGCSDCEYREPGGGYRMADQSASRPKWIPNYDHRSFPSSGKEHTTKWSSELFTEGPGKKTQIPL